MIAPYFYMKNFFQREECNDILKNYTKDMSFGTVGYTENKDSRKSKVSWITQDLNLLNKVAQAFYIANTNNFNVDINLPFGVNEIQITEYDEAYEGKLDRHIDSDLFTGQEHTINQRFVDRKLSITMLLEDDSNYEGGKFMLQSLVSNEWYTPPELKEKGDLIVFPSILPHKVTQVTKGTRYSLVSWANGPHWK